MCYDPLYDMIDINYHLWNMILNDFSVIFKIKYGFQQFNLLKTRKQVSTK